MKPIVATTTLKEKYALTLIIAFCVLLHSCRKPDGPDEVPPPEPPGSKIGLLKQIVVQNLPSPYYAFGYADDGVTTGISFASGFFIYELSYKNKRLDRMVNQINGNALVYEYTRGRVSSIREIRPDNSVVWHYTFEYKSNTQVSEIRYYLANKSGADSLLHRKIHFLYFPNGNLDRYIDYVNLSGQKLEWVQTVAYSNYDQGKNVDGFRLFKQFFDHVLYLPGVQFQKNNPWKVLITGHTNDYVVNDTWTYENELPVHKQSNIKQTKGNGPTGNIISNTTFSYY